eukprot:CAMPEP_0182611920 /NCGR_PEP_ID=MMETSP1330-20130603/15949_1 /TAXON_ID=464278 /ORGANISM="Picochlorum sp., Strain RCC944" /LENGTH=166 /DNA_ID=CAMNT_0024831381 /DNA_START=75 /DNA_END=572 /DNA_ORIENTATION=-
MMETSSPKQNKKKQDVMVVEGGGEGKQTPKGLPPTTAPVTNNKRKRNDSGDEEANSILNLDKLDTNALLKLQGEQLERFESYRRSAIPRVAMKKLLLAVTGQNPEVNVLIVACGVAKLLVGEIVETAKKLAKERGHEGPLRAEDIKRAYTITLEESRLPLQQKTKC